MAVEITLNTPLGPVVRRVRPPECELTPAELTPLFLHLADALVGQVLEEADRQGLQVSCQPGCGACCRQLVPLSEPEIFAISGYVESLPDGRRQQIERRFDLARQALDAAGLLDELRSPPKDSRGITELSYRYFAAGVPCPFLEEGSCSIHEQRPAICREYNVLSDPKNCENPREETIRSIGMPVNLANVISRTMAKLCGFPAKVTPLTLALEWGRGRPERGQLRFDPLKVIRCFVESYGELVSKEFGDGEEEAPPPFAV